MSLKGGMKVAVVFGSVLGIFRGPDYGATGYGSYYSSGSYYVQYGRWQVNPYTYPSGRSEQSVHTLSVPSPTPVPYTFPSRVRLCNGMGLWKGNHSSIGVGILCLSQFPPLPAQTQPRPPPNQGLDEYGEIPRLSPILHRNPASSLVESVADPEGMYFVMRSRACPDLAVWLCFRHC